MGIAAFRAASGLGLQMMWLYRWLHAAVAYMSNPNLAWGPDLRTHFIVNATLSLRILMTLGFAFYGVAYVVPVYFDAVQSFMTYMVMLSFFLCAGVFYLTVLRGISGLYLHYMMVSVALLSSAYLGFNILYSIVYLQNIPLSLFFVPWVVPLFLDVVSRFRPGPSYIVMAIPTVCTVIGFGHYLVSLGEMPKSLADVHYFAIFCSIVVVFVLFCLQAFLRTHYLDLRLEAERNAVMAMELSERLRIEGELSEVRYQLERLSRNLAASALAVSISHEINQPLTAISTNAAAGVRFLKRQQMDEVSECLTAIEQGAHRAGAVVNGIRSLLRRNTPSFQPFQPNDMLRETLDLMRLEAKQRDIILVDQLDAELPTITGDRIRLQQVCINLISNAMDAMAETPPKQRYITVRSTAVNVREISIAIMDQGCGMPPQVLERIFEPFYSTKETGTGIGLSISKSIIDAHDGQMLVKSDGSGTAFTLLLPILPEVEGRATA